MLGCARERNAKNERAAARSRNLARISSIHPSACVTRERAAAPAAASVLPLGSTDLRLHPTGTGLVNALPCQGQRSSGVSATSELSLTCPPNAHAEPARPSTCRPHSA